MLGFAVGRVQHVLAVDVTDTGRTDRAIERNTGDGQCCGGTQHGNDVSRDLRVGRDHGGNHLNLIEETFREQRADRTVNQTGDQGFRLARTAFTLEEATGDPASRIGTLLIVDGQREEVTAGNGLFLADNGDEYRGIVHAGHDGTGRLTSHDAGFQGDGVLTVLEGFYYRIHVNFLYLFWVANFAHDYSRLRNKGNPAISFVCDS